MAENKTREVLQDVGQAISDAEAQLPAARELIAIMREAGEDTAKVQTLMVEIETRIRQWARVLERRGVSIPTPTPPETE